MDAKLETQVFLGILVIASVAFIWLIMPFFAPVFWAVAIAIIFRPVFQWLLKKFPRWPNVNALLTLLTCVIIVIMPAIFLIASIISQGMSLYERIDEGEIDLQEYLEQIQEAVPVLRTWMERQDISMDDLREGATEAAMAGGQIVAQSTLNIGQNIFGFVLAMGVMLYVAFFLIRDGHKLVGLLMRALPLNKEREELLFTKFAEVTRATIKGNIIIAIVEGALGGIIFWVLGIPGPLLWGVVMAIVSLIPVIGPGLIWVPVAIYMLATGDFVSAIVLIAFGSIVIGLVDNFLRPILVGRDTKLPDYLVLLSTLGGLVLFGINGFVMGPVIAALFTVVWGIFIREFKHQEVPTVKTSPDNGKAND
ncbi:AI-2E family transporter [Marinimicrobium sp. ABcell2]|uniref:AI-2E family transporter n=1 Tax=Marinimicrobium sp. ABcell2 TaxID=3069751 RepID=UPI0027B6D414|nr:AI-2E family transporter [Marinimicrobium sp. ABcell2]MDQ2075543.1 AI-2E family transporter [Marinimicrobium sp. ABcell2]